MPSLRFLPADVTIPCADGETVFAVAQRAGVAIETACVGKATCGLCRVKVVAGEAHLGPYTRDEEKHLGNVYFITRVRLACQAPISGGDVTVELAPKRKVHPR